MIYYNCSDQDVMVSVVRNLGGYKVTDTVGPTTTHIITGDQRRTLNVLSAIANGCWLLSKEWVSMYHVKCYST